MPDLRANWRRPARSCDADATVCSRNFRVATPVDRVGGMRRRRAQRRAARHSRRLTAPALSSINRPARRPSPCCARHPASADIPRRRVRMMVRRAQDSISRRSRSAHGPGGFDDRASTEPCRRVPLRQRRHDARRRSDSAAAGQRLTVLITGEAAPARNCRARDSRWLVAQLRNLSALQLPTTTRELATVNSWSPARSFTARYRISPADPHRRRRHAIPR